MKVGLVHDWLTGMRGGERVLHELCLLFPDADLYTLVHVPGSTSPEIENRRIHASPLSKLPGAAKHYRKFLPLFPWAIEHFELRGYDLVISTSHAVAKGVRVAPGTPHLCYCFTPMRYIWDQADAYLGTGLHRWLVSPIVGSLRRWDVRSSTPDRVTQFIAISDTVADRIARAWGREAPVIYPPADVERIRPSFEPAEPFFLLVGGFVPYKREEIVIEAFRQLPHALIVAGDGPTRSRIQAGAPENVRFVGRVSDAALTNLYQRCRALIYPQEEDFGIIPVEVQAAGRPVIALGRGGATETVIPLADPQRIPTGVWFEEQSAAGIVAGVQEFLEHEGEFSVEATRRHAEGFSNARFQREIKQAIQELLGC